MNTKRFWHWLGLPCAEDMQMLTSRCEAHEQRLIELEAKTRNQEKALQLLLEHLNEVNQSITASSEALHQDVKSSEKALLSALEETNKRIGTVNRANAEKLQKNLTSQITAQSKKIVAQNEQNVVASTNTLLDQVNSRYQESIEREMNGIQTIYNRLDTLRLEIHKDTQATSKNILTTLEKASKQSDIDQSMRAETLKSAILDDIHRLTQQICSNDNSSVAAWEHLSHQIKALYTLTSNSAANQEELLRMLIVNSVQDEIEGKLNK